MTIWRFLSRPLGPTRQASCVPKEVVSVLDDLVGPHDEVDFQFDTRLQQCVLAEVVASAAYALMVAGHVMLWV